MTWVDLAEECKRFEQCPNYHDRVCWFCIHFSPHTEECEYPELEIKRKLRSVHQYKGQRILQP